MFGALPVLASTQDPPRSVGKTQSNGAHGLQNPKGNYYATVFTNGSLTYELDLWRFKKPDVSD